MKHWDLTPNEVVTLRRGSDPRSDVRARFRSRDTRCASFVRPSPEECFPDTAYFKLLEDGTLIDEYECIWSILGPDRNTRILAEQPLGERKHFTLLRPGRRAFPNGGAR